MRILLVHNYYQQRGGEDTVFENELALLQGSEHNVEALTFHNNQITSTLDKLKAGVQLFYNQQSAEALADKIIDFKPDVIHVHNFFPIASPALYSVAQKFGIPIVQTLHNFRLLCANALLFRDGKTCEKCVDETVPTAGISHGCYRDSKLQSAALAGMTTFHKLKGTWHHQVDSYIVLTEFARQKFNHSNLALPLGKMIVKPNFTFDAGEGDFSQRDNSILFVGRLSVEKDIPTLLEAFKNSKLPLKIIGDGPYKAMVEESASQHSNIHYLGYQNKAAVMTYLKRSRGFILPSTCYEGCPMTILEALSTGTPVLVSKTGGLAEFVGHEHNGLHFEPGNVEDLKNQVSRLATDPCYNQWCKNARSSYLESYTPEKNLLSIIEIYQTTLQNYQNKADILPADVLPVENDKKAEQSA